MRLDPYAITVEWALPCASILALATMALRRTPREDSPLLRGDVAGLGWLMSRLAYLLVFWVVVGRDLSSDMWAWDANTAGMERGLVPGRDFFNLYGPAYPYLQYLGRWLTPSFHRVGTLWIFALGDLVTVWAGWKIATALFGDLAGKRVRLWLVLDPLLWHHLVVRAQDESLFVGTLLLSLWLIHRARTHAGMVVLALGLCATKVTYAPYALAVLLALPAADRSWRGAWGTWCAVVAGVYAGYLATGARLTSGDNYATHSVNWGVGVSLSDAARRILPDLPLESGLAVYGLACAVVIPWYCWRIRDCSVLVRGVNGVAMAHAVSLLTMPCSVSPYLAQGAAFVLLAALALPLGPSSRTALLLLLVASGFLAVMYWTTSRAFSIPMKPVCVLLHGWVALLLWRRGGTAAPAGEPAMSGGAA